MKKALVLALVAGLGTLAMAQPASTDLGMISDTSSDYNVADLSVIGQITGGQVAWYRFTVNDLTSPTGYFFDIDLFATSSSNVPDTEIGVYDSVGNLVASDDDDGHSLRSALTFGNTTPRTMPADPFGFTNGAAANGRDGNLLGGTTYYLAVVLYNATFSGGWTVTTTATASPNAYQMNFRTDIPVPAPASLALLGLGGLVARRRR